MAMMSAMAGENRFPATAVALLAGLALAVGACSDGDDDAAALLEAAASATTTTAAPSTTNTTAATAIASTTSLSEQRVAEVEIEALVTDWWIKAYDPEQGDAAGGLEYTTGLMAARIEENRATAADEGYSRVSRGGATIQVTSMDIDVDEGQGIVNTCGGSDLIRLDAETGEPITDGDDPAYQTTSEFYVELTADGWRISEWVPSFNTGTPVECTVDA